MRCRSPSAISAAVLAACLASTADGMRDSGVLCDGPDCFDAVPRVAALIQVDGEDHLLAKADPIAKPEKPEQGGGYFGIPTSALASFWGVAGGIYAVLVLAVLVLFGGILNIGADAQAEEDDPVPDVKGVSTKEVFDDSSKLSIAFKDEGLERLWTIHNKKKGIEAGLWTLILLTVVVIMYQLMRLYQGLKIDCLSPNWEIQVLKYSSFGTLLVVLSVGLKQGSSLIFWLGMAFYFFLIPAVNMPPFQWSCQTLQKTCMESRNKPENWFVRQSVHRVDCTISGQTALQMMMTWLLILPWLIPRYELMHVCWLWILLVYVGWTVAWQHLAEEHPIFDAEDIVNRTLLLSATLLMATGMKYYLERSQRSRFVRDRKQREASKGMFLILEDMMPLHVIGPMMKGETIAEHIDRVSILFVLISDFDKKTSTMGPSKLLAFLNEKFSKMDEICTRNGVTKIETVGEEYVAAVGVLPEDVKENREKGHTHILKRLLQASGEILQLQTDDTRFKMGVHTGSIVAGVIGTKLPRYRLFGNTINQAARMMQKAPVGELQFGDETWRDVPEELLPQVTDRGLVEMKGKGQVQAYTFKPSVTGAPESTPDTAEASASASKVATMAAAAEAGGVVSFEDGSRKPRRSLLGLVAASKAAALNDPTARLLDAEVDRRFTNAVGDFTDGDDSGAFGQLLSEKEGFTPEMEERWLKIHHEEHMCKSIATRFGLESLLLLIVSCYELTCMFNDEVWKYNHALYSGKWRDAVFVYCRGGVLAISISWWYIADTRQDWIKANRFKSQMGFLLSYCFSVILLYASYDAFVCSDTKDFRQKNLYKDFKAPHDQIYMLNFLLFFFFISQQHNLLFWPSLSFIALAIIISVSDFVINLVRPDSKFEAPISFLGKMMFIAQAILNTVVSYTDEQQSRRRFKQREAFSNTKDRTEHILRTLMPELVVQEISKDLSGVLPSHHYRHATVAQSDLCGFTKLSSTKTPHEVVGFMGQLFGMFDELTDKHGVYKVETVGDAYIAAVAERPLTQENSPIRVVLFSLDMVRAVDDWAKRQGGIGVTCRVGVNYGECWGGVVGDSMQRYHLFGDILTVMEILESTAPEGRVQVSRALKDEVNRQLADGATDETELPEVVSFDERQDDDLRTSKGEAHTYESVGGRTFIVDSDKPLRCQD